MFYLTTYSTHFTYGYMTSDLWLRTILIVRKETLCRHMGYSFRLTARVLLYAPSHRQDSTYQGVCYTSRGALAGTRNIVVLMRSCFFVMSSNLESFLYLHTLARIRTRTHAYAHKYTHVHTYIHTHTHVPTLIHTSTHARTHTHACENTHNRKNRHTHARTHTHTHTRHKRENTHTRTTKTHTHTQTQTREHTHENNKNKHTHTRTHTHTHTHKTS